MTYRDRRLARAERLRDASDKNAAKSSATHDSTRKIMDGIPFGQPILVGHHSEKRARADVRRIDSGMRRAFELGDKSRDQASRADEIERQAENAIYSDDPDAVERLEQKISELETEREEEVAECRIYRKDHRAELKTMTAYERSEAVPYPTYSISNIGGRISQARQRLVLLKHQQAQAAGDAPVRYRTITARYAGDCGSCGAKNAATRSATPATRRTDARFSATRAGLPDVQHPRVAVYIT